MNKLISFLCILFSCCILLSDSIFFQKEVKALEIVSIQAPEKVRAKSYKGKKLRLSWKQTEGAEGYVIQEYKNAKKKFVKVAETAGVKTDWTSGKTKKKRTYRVCAYRMEDGKKIMGSYSYTVSAIPYKQKSKTVNAGEVLAKQYQVKLGLREAKQMEVTVKNSRFAKNKKAKLIDNSLRWYTTDSTVATVDEKGVVTARGKVGNCQIYARAHNGNYTGLIQIEVCNFARPESFDVTYTQPDITTLLKDYKEDLSVIAEYFEYCHAQGNTQKGSISINTERSGLEVSSPKISIDPIRENIWRVLNDYPGNMFIICYSNGVEFDLSDNKYHLLVVYIFSDVRSDFEESQYHFFVAPRWLQEFYRYM